MSKHVFASALLASTLAFPPLAAAAGDAELAEIREQIRQMKQDYEARIRALEERLKAAEAAPPPAAQAAAAPPPGPATEAPAAAKAPAGNALAAFNPGVSVVLQGTYQDLSRDPSQYGFRGIQLADDVGPGPRSFGLGESEITLFANVDHLFAGNLTVSLAPDDSVEVEEAFGVATAVPFGIVPKFGRFFSGIGYLNEQHQHVWDFQDAPLVYQAYLGGQFAQDGLQVKWVAPTDLLLEFGGEVGNGDAYPGSPRGSNGVGAWSAFVHAGGDLGDNASWRAGVSYLSTKADGREGTQPDAAGDLVRTAFTGDARTTIADFVVKYAPTGNAKDVNLKLQGEYFRQRSSGTLTYDSDGALGLTSTGDYRATQSGFYLQGIWQFMPAWRVGLRYDSLDTGTPDYGTNAAYLDAGAFRPRKGTAMIDWTPSEFSRLRLQYAQNRERPGYTDNEFLVQYILSLGAHPAHRY